MIRIERLVSIAICVAMVGCATAPSGPVFTSLIAAPSGKSVLYIYRPSEYYGSGLNYTVTIDEKKMGDVGNGGYIVIPVQPGKHTIRGSALAYGEKPLEASFKEGNSFIRMKTDKGFGGFSATLSLETVDESAASKELAKTKREPERFLDKEI